MNLKSIVLLISLLAITFHSNCNPIGISAKVDEKSELLSIVFKLAGANEYSWGRVPEYNSSTDKHFEGFKNHEAVRLAKRLRKLKGISYDAVMSIAIHLEVVDSKLQLNPNFSEKSIDKRWSKKDVDTFVSALNKFYVDSDFRQFFDSNSELYDQTVKNFDAVLNTINFDWFNSFFGVEPDDNYFIILNLSNGPANYGPKTTDINGFEKKYAIIGVGLVDSLGIPYFSNRFIPTIIHEFCHSFCNQLIDSKSKELERSGKMIYSKVEKQMRNQAYGTYRTMQYEYLVRASVIKYIEHTDSNKINLNQSKADEIGKGFYFINDLVEQLSVYELNRERYESLEKFMPEIVSLFDSISNNYTAIYSALLSNCPKIEFSSIINGSKINPSSNEFIIKFNQPMDTSSYGFGYGKGGEKNFPKFENIEWTDDRTIKASFALERNKKYTLRLYNPAYLSTEFYPVIEDFELAFKTTK
jgi:hypothetical protein